MFSSVNQYIISSAANNPLACIVSNRLVPSPIHTCGPTLNIKILGVGPGNRGMFMSPNVYVIFSTFNILRQCVGINFLKTV